MLIGNLTKLHYKKKAWITPRHPLFFEPDSYKVYYAAAVIMQAEMNQDYDVLHNFELERLLYKGLGLDRHQVSSAMELAKDVASVMEYLYEANRFGKQNYFLMLDLFNVSIRGKERSREEEEFLHLFVRMLDVAEDYVNLCRQFIEAAYEENEGICRSIYHSMEEAGMGISLMDLKYYIMTLYDTFTCTQKMLEEKKELRLVDRCQIEEDLVLKAGMRLVFDRAVVRIYGNIALQGGELIVEDSRIIRKSDSHRACINIHSNGVVKVIRTEVDCRNLGMFIRAQDGRVSLKDCEIYHTTRGAAVRFWGELLEIDNCYFHHCYSPEDGGAVMMRGGKAQVTKCRFRHCEAGKGGAVYGLDKMQIESCRFEKCYASEFGAAVYYVGSLEGKTSDLYYEECFPEGEETIQYLKSPKGIDILGKCEIKTSTILDCEIDIYPQGFLQIQDVVVYLKYPIRCRGNLAMKNVKLLSMYLEQKDMIVLEHAKMCRLSGCILDGMGEHSGIFSTGTRVELEDCVFCNMKGGRAVFNASTPLIKRCIFNYCQNGGVHCQGGTIEECLFVNCRAKNGAGIMMLGKRGIIQECRFVRCISDITEGAIDRNVGSQVIRCEFQDCR